MKKMHDIKPFTVIATNYIDLQGNLKLNPNGTPQKGLFLVLANIDSNSVLGCKITSQITTYLNEFTVPLSRLNNPFLYADSFIQCDKIQVFKNTPYTTTLGVLENSDRFRVYNSVRKVFDNIMDESFKHLIPFKKPTNYISPNVIKRDTYFSSSPCEASEKEREVR